MWRKLTNINRILVPVDLTDGSLCAAEAALTLSRDRKVQIYLIHVMQKAVAPIPPATAEGVVSGAADATPRYEALEEFFTKKIKARSSFAYIIRSGVPSDEILTFAREEAVDLIILPIGRKDEPGGFIPGGIASHIIEHATVPVLVVKPDPFPKKPATVPQDGEVD